ncbi:MAG TPA: protein-methionine-sulfoxide reductase heme-binding subunit MsrQ [Gemmatimonadaceae bacterium]|nr:protein-methionine-sulfoxide reductase heme-binding subunit MsrQ [Gemmatimonadaceae bacterium]
MTSVAATPAPVRARRPARGPRIGRALKPVAFAVLLAPALWLTYAVLTGRIDGDVVKIIEIDTGTLALRSLAYTLAITPLRQLTGWAWLSTYRRMMGLFVFFYATVHMLIYFVLDLELQFGEIWTSILKRPYITVGMLSWMILVPLALTSPNGIAKKLGGVRWKKLHQLTYVVAVTATTHYLWAVKKDTFWPFVYFVLFGALLLPRLLQWWRRRQASQTSTSTT